jgi:hypothetical protein
LEARIIGVWTGLGISGHAGTPGREEFPSDGKITGNFFESAVS